MDRSKFFRVLVLGGAALLPAEGAVLLSACSSLGDDFPVEGAMVGDSGLTDGGSDVGQRDAFPSEGPAEAAAPPDAGPDAGDGGDASSDASDAGDAGD